MHTKALRFINKTIFILVLNCLTAVNLYAEALQPEAVALRTLINNHCSSCHTGSGYVVNKYGDFLNYNILADLEKSSPGIVFHKVQSGEMPKPDFGDFLSQQERDDFLVKIQNWYDAGKPPLAEKINNPDFVTYKRLLKEVKSDLETLKNPEYIRYVSFAHIYNNPSQIQYLKTYGKALSFLLNSVSTKKDITLPRDVSGKGYLFAIDLEKYDLQTNWCNAFSRTAANGERDFLKVIFAEIFQVLTQGGSFNNNFQFDYKIAGEFEYADPQLFKDIRATIGFKKSPGLCKGSVYPGVELPTDDYSDEPIVIAGDRLIYYASQGFTYYTLLFKSDDPTSSFKSSVGILDNGQITALDVSTTSVVFPFVSKYINNNLPMTSLTDQTLNGSLRAGFKDSGVSKNNRIIERYSTASGSFWRSIDFLNSFDDRNVFNYPIQTGLYFQPPLTQLLDTKHKGSPPDASEIIFSLPNGLNAYFIAGLEINGVVQFRDRFIIKPSNQIVTDPQMKDGILRVGVSCMSCHYNGLIYKRDQVYDTHSLLGFKGFTIQEAKYLEKTYGNHTEFSNKINSDNKQYRQAMKKMNIDSTATNVLRTSYIAFERILTFDDISYELGLEPQALEQKWKDGIFSNEPQVEIILAQSLFSGVNRDQFELNKQKLVRLIKY